MSKNFGQIKGVGVQNYKLFMDKLKVGLLNQMLMSRGLNGRANTTLSKWMEQSEAIKKAVQLMTKFLGEQSSPIFAQKLFRTYHVIQLHSKLWSQRLLVKFGKNFIATYSRLYSKRWLYSLVLLSFCEAPASKSGSSFALQHSIEEKELKDHMNDLEYIRELTAATVVCPHCKDRLVVDKKVSNVEYCHCPESSSAYNRKIEELDDGIKFFIIPSSNSTSRNFGYPWTPFYETPDLLIWRQPVKDKPGLFMYKVYGYYNDVMPRDFLETQLDMEYRKTWDATTTKLRNVEEDKQNHVAIIHWEMQWPKFFANRDYVFARRYTVDEKAGTIVILNKSISYKNVPEVSGVVRVKEYFSVMHIKAVKGMDQPGVEFGLTYYDNPGLSLPEWLMNYVATISIPEFLNKIRIAARKRKQKKSAHFFDTSATSKELELAISQDGANKTDVLSKFFKENFVEHPQAALGDG